MAQNYTVNYNIKVNSTSAIQAIDKFVASTNQLTKTVSEVDKLTASLKRLTKQSYKLNFNVGNANRSLDSVLHRLREIDRLAKRNRTIAISQSSGRGARSSAATGSAIVGGSGGGGGNTPSNKTSTKTSTKASTKASASRSVYAGSRKPVRGGNYAYKALGPSMIDSGGIGAIDMLKGMGIMYGITGLGTLMSNIVRDATQYDNTIQTTRNILQSHDMRDNFNQRFGGMERTIRNVGLATKYTAPEVADASKFLAMAGLKVEDINQAIRPVADIALVGDTDLGSTADMVTNIMTGYRMQANQIRNAADVMTMTFTSANTTLTQLAEAYKYSASILNSGGVNFETATAALGVLGNAGLQGSHGGTTMRMIMNNLVNPTKKQQLQWKALGVSTKGADGRLRPINEIFSDLNAKGAGLEEMSRLFRITAAPGAVVLAQNSDEWNRIIRENYASQGLSNRLAIGKQNTIQGLWAQITSQLTENGLGTFEGMQSQIRGFMLEILNWLRSNEAKKYMEDFAQMLMSLIKMFKEFTQTLLETYHRFGPLIKVWLELQVKLSAILIPLRIFRSLMNFGGLLIGATRSIGGFTVTLGRLLLSMRSLSAFKGQWNATMTSIAHGWGLMRLGRIPADGFSSFTTAAGNVHRDIPRDTMLRYRSMAMRNQGVASMMVGTSGLLSSAGGILGGIIGSQIGEPGSGWNMAATAGGGLLGMAGFSALSSIPLYGWAAAAALAFGYLTYKVAASNNAAEEGQKAWQKLIDTTKVENGVLSGEGLTITDRYYELAYNKSLSLTEVTQKRVDLLKEELGLKNGEVKNDEGKYIDRQKLDSVLGLAKGADSMLNSNGMGAMAQKQINAFQPGLVSYRDDRGRRANPLIAQAGRWYWKDRNGKEVMINNPWGVDDHNDALAAMSALYTEGYNGTESKMIRDQYQNKLRSLLMTNGKLSDILAVRDEWAKNFAYGAYLGQSSADTRPGSFNYGYEDLKDASVWNGQKIAMSYPYRQGALALMSPIFGKDAPVWSAAESYYGGLRAGTLSEQQVTEFMMKMDVQLAEVLNSFSSASNDTIKAWLGTLRFENGKFNVDPQNLTLLQTKFQDILQVLNMMPTPAQNAAENLFRLTNNLNNIALAQIWYNNLPGGARSEVNGTGANYGEVKAINRQKYRYNGSAWQAIFDDGSPMNSIPTVSDDVMAKMVGAAAQNKSGFNFNHDPSQDKPHKIPTLGADSSRYKNHYTSQNAAPKQVIVRIGNLMNVQSVDLTNKDNAMVIDNLKGQLTQALVDVVHDFDESWNG